MRKLTVISILVFALLALAAIMVTAEDAKHEYVGEKKCKMCHKDVYTAWEASDHATTFADLSDEEKAKPECVTCHITGEMADGTVIENVSCEACHGPGSDYKSAKIMSKKKWAAEPEKYKQMAIDAGLVYPTEENCVRCHKKEGNPNFKEFDFETMKAKVHPVAAEE